MFFIFQSRNDLDFAGKNKSFPLKLPKVDSYNSEISSNVLYLSNARQ